VATTAARHARAGAGPSSQEDVSVARPARRRRTNTTPPPKPATATTATDDVSDRDRAGLSIDGFEARKTSRRGDVSEDEGDDGALGVVIVDFQFAAVAYGDRFGDPESEATAVQRGVIGRETLTNLRE
jgi:hypothetical protein